MADPFTILVDNLNKMGFFGFLLPFVFTFAVVFALLLKNKFSDNNRINGVIALVVAFFVIGYGGPGLAAFFVNLFGMAAIIIAVLLVIIFFVAMTGTDASAILQNRAAHAVLAGIGIIVAWIALGSFNVRISDAVVGIVFVIILTLLTNYFSSKTIRF